MSANTSKDASWAVPWASCPTTNYVILPSDVGELLGLPRDQMPQMGKPERTLAFLRRPSGAVRVLGVRKYAPLFGEAMSRHEALGLATAATGNGMFALPDLVAQHMEVTLKHIVGSTARSTDDPVAWFMPMAEYYLYRKLLRSGKPGPDPSGGFHIYLHKAFFPQLMPSLEEMETTGKIAPIVFAPFTR